MGTRKRPLASTLTPDRNPLSLRTARHIAQISQKKLAAAAGVDHSFISLIESGDRDLRGCGFDVVKRIAWALHITPDELVALASPRPTAAAPDEPDAVATGGRT